MDTSFKRRHNNRSRWKMQSKDMPKGSTVMGFSRVPTAVFRSSTSLTVMSRLSSCPSMANLVYLAEEVFNINALVSISYILLCHYSLLNFCSLLWPKEKTDSSRNLFWETKHRPFSFVKWYSSFVDSESTLGLTHCHVDQCYSFLLLIAAVKLIEVNR